MYVCACTRVKEFNLKKVDFLIEKRKRRRKTTFSLLSKLQRAHKVVCQFDIDCSHVQCSQIVWNSTKAVQNHRIRHVSFTIMPFKVFDQCKKSSLSHFRDATVHVNDGIFSIRSGNRRRIWNDILHIHNDIVCGNQYHNRCMENRQNFHFNEKLRGIHRQKSVFLCLECFFIPKLLENKSMFTFSLFQIGSKIRASSRSIYVELNKKIELVYKVLRFIIMKFTYVGIIVPQLLITGVDYFVYDLREESFYLTCPVMCVCCVVLPSIFIII